MLHGVLTALGVVTIVVLVRHVGPARLAGVLRSAAPWLPGVLALEGARIGTDALGTRSLYGPAGRRVALYPLLHAHVIGYPAALLLPAGRVAAEAVRAALLAPWVGAPTAAAAAVAHQAISLFGVFLISLPVLAVALATWGTSAMSIAIAVQASTAIGLGLALQIASRRPELGRWARRLAAPPIVAEGEEVREPSRTMRLAARAGHAAATLQGAVSKLPFLPLGAIAAALLGRICQVAQFGMLAHAAGAGAGLRPALLCTGVHLVGTAAGDLIPGQAGATDGAFVLAAGALQIPVASALAIPLLVHATQLFWAALGLVAPALPKALPPLGAPPPSAPRTE